MIKCNKHIYTLILLLLFNFTIGSCSVLNSGSTVNNTSIQKTSNRQNNDSESDKKSSEPPSLSQTDKNALIQKDSISLVSIEPYFNNIYAGVAAKALAEDNLKQAKLEFTEIAQLSKDPQISLRAKFLSIYLAFYTGNYQTTFDEMPLLADSLPLLDDVIYEISAKAALKLKKFDKALNFANNINIKSLEKQLIVADSLYKMDEKNDALTEYENILMEYSYFSRRLEVRFLIIKCIVNQLNGGLLNSERPNNEVTSINDSDDVIQEPENVLAAQNALQHLRFLLVSHPNNYWTKQSLIFEKQLRKITGDKPIKVLNESKKAIKTYDLASNDRRKKRNKRAEERFKQVVNLARNGGKLQCDAMFNEALVVSYQRDHERASNMFWNTAKRCTKQDIRIKALYKCGKSSISASNYKQAIESFNKVEKEFPYHSYADDARLHTANSYKALGNHDKFLELVLSIPDAYPGGDMSAEALWQGAKYSLENDKMPQAISLLTKYFELFPIEKGWYYSGRSGYWLGRVLQLNGDIEAASQKFEYVISTAPLSYYMVLSYSRLHNIDPQRAQLLLASLAPVSGEEQTTISKQIIEDNPEFAQGIELVKLGLVSRGRKVLKNVLHNSNSNPDLYRATAALFRHVGLYSDAKEVTTEIPDGWKRRYPAGNDYQSWALAYPTAYDDHVASASKESNISKFLIWAIMREESGFNERIESWANAMGLMQLIMPTAKSMGKVLDIKVSRKTLKQPETNIRLGSAYLSYLKSINGGHVALMIPSYNAGGGAVSKWKKEKPHMPLDMFVETIPYSQTRGYTKRVLSTFATYNFLYNQNRTIPLLDFTLQ